MKNKKIRMLLLSILGIVIVLLISILIYKNNVLNQIYNENINNKQENNYNDFR